RFKELIDKIRSKSYIDKKSLDEIIKELQRILLSADVNVKVVFEISKRIKERVLNEYSQSRGVQLKDLVIKILYEELVKILGEEKRDIIIAKKPFVILFIGLEGSGKTTSVAKLAKYFAENGLRVGVFSLDIHRPAAIEQLEQLVNRIQADVEKIKFINIEGTSLNEKIRTILDILKDRDVILVDTAGRHKNEESLLKELENIYKYLTPDFTILVIDAYMGQKAYDHTLALKSRVNIDGIIVSKMDGSSKGGGAISASVASGAKILFLGVGEKVDDLEPYDPKSFVSRLLGLGDLDGLLTRVERLLKREVHDEKKLRELAKGRLTLVDVVTQFENIEKMGGLYKILSYLPGFSGKFRKEEIDEMETVIRKWKAAINSMTIEEKINPSIIKGSRITRISRGSGVDERLIKNLIKQYKIMQKLMKDRKHKRMFKEMLKSTRQL
ncbi:TPA: signal recognition particle protein, partial [Candidatus Geothermarchaeota archaeon]|nr:signal recognition particle protein [Candidatus Geothermarchaeota archaeon]